MVNREKPITIFVEGGFKGDLAKKCRRSYRIFLEKANLLGSKFKIESSGRRQQAYEVFYHALKDGQKVLLLVDSEAPVSTQNPWEHLRNRQGDQWEKPVNAKNEDCHLMVQCMESWFLADKKTLQDFFKKDFKESALPKNTDIESLDKDKVYQSLTSASKDTSKGKYSKGAHSFEILAMLDPQKVSDASPWAKRFLDELRSRMGVSPKQES
jgi:hypothetical protein